MAPVVHSAEVYARELARYGHGRPMWIPEHPDEGGAQLGDVGFIDTKTGEFKRLFNVLREWESREDPPMNPPLGFTPLLIRAPLKQRIPNYLGPTPICSKHIEVQAAEGNAQAGGGLAGGELSYSFSWTSKAGAVLQTTDHADKEAIYTNRICPAYMAAHYKSWCDYATEMGFDLDAVGTVGPVLVRGWVKTSGWALTAWSSDTRAKRFEINGNAADVAGLGLAFTFEASIECPPEHRNGPLSTEPRRVDASGRGPVRDQTVFMSYYKMKSRDRFWARVVSHGAGAQERFFTRFSGGPGGSGGFIGGPGPQGSGGGEGGSGGNLGPVSGVRHVADYTDPVDELLDYILKLSDSEFAIACDADLSQIFGGQEWPEDITQALADRLPRIDKIGDNVGMISVEQAIYNTYPPPTQAAPAGTSEDSSRRLSGTGGEATTHDTSSGTLTTNKGSPDIRTITWPHIVFNAGSETGVPCPAAVSLDGRLLGVGYEDCSVRLWDLESEGLRCVLTGHRGVVRCAAFSSDCKWLASGSGDGTIIIWDTSSGANTTTLTGHTSDVSTLAFSPDCRHLVSGSVDCIIKFWDVQAGAQTMEVNDLLSSVEVVSYTPDGSRVVACTGNMGHIYSSDGKTLICKMGGHEGIIYSMDISSSGTRIVTGGEDHTARIWATETGTELVIIREHSEPIWSVKFSSDDRSVVCGSYDTTITIHNALDGELLHAMAGDGTFVESVAFSPDGEFVASGGADGTVLLWDTQNGREVLEFKGHMDKISSVQFSPDHETLISSSDDGSIRLWNVIDALRVC